MRGCEKTISGTLGKEKPHVFLYLDTVDDLANMVELNKTHPEWIRLPSVFDYPS